MNTTATVLRILVRALGVAQILLGLLFWTAPIHQNFGVYTLVPLHMLCGLSIVICLWVLAALGARAGAGAGRVAFAVFWGFFVPVFGVVHGGILQGEWHWVIQVLHLLVGVVAIGQVESLATRIKARSTPAAPASRLQPAAS